ncbi:MAG: hypothetical protein MUP16_02800 [Sedimentisphaerales bacterium]|nr:hypothetical protein [Sedimentisphaerales bacterium]
MLASGYEYIDVILAVVVGAVIMFIVILLTAKPAKHDEKAVRTGGIIGFFVYRLGRWLGGLFKRKDT